MDSKTKSRMRRARKGRMQMREKRATRLTVHRSAKHMYAQVVSPEGDRILAQASTLDPSLRGDNTGNVEAAGDLIALRAKEAGVDRVAFDRSGYKYHGRVKALAAAARKGGLEF